MLIPARGGSKRVPGKNTRPLAGKPLISYTIRAAQESGVFNRTLVSSDDLRTLQIASQLGADVLKRPSDISGALSPDIEWVRHALEVTAKHRTVGTFSILRATSPFRTAATIQRAFQRWHEHCNDGYTSLRAVEPVSQHPGKMWQVQGDEMLPLMLQPQEQPWHDSQLASLPIVYVQNASLEIAPVTTVIETGTISGSRVLPFLTHGLEGFDINTEADWQRAEQLASEGALPPH